MIKMIAGTYGYRVNGRIEAKNSKSAPFKLDPKEEKRLVDAKVAVFVENTEKTVTTEDGEKAKELSKMSLNELKALATEKGIEVKGNNKKVFVDALLALDEETSDDEDADDENADEETSEDETAPTFGNESTVVE